MQATAVTEAGYYWNFQQGESPRIVYFDADGQWFSRHGTEKCFWPRHAIGEFIGPITYPLPDPSEETKNALRKHLRNEFAKAALTGMSIKSDLHYSKEDHKLGYPDADSNRYAATAFRIADAMLIESEKRNA